MSEPTDNPELEDEQMTRTIETDAREEDERWIESESRGVEDAEREWEELADEELPPRPRSRFRRPLPIALAALLIASLGFLGGVLVQKSAGSSGGGGGAPGGGGLPGLAAAAQSKAEGGSEAAAAGTVSSVDGKTIYVKESDGTIVAVKAEDGTTVTRDAEVSAKAVHPGDTVVVEGSKKGSTVKASSISATESGVESSSGFSLPGASSGGGEGESGGGESGTSVGSLFEE